MNVQKHIMLAGNTAWSIYNFRGKLIEALRGRGYRVTVLAPHDAVFTPRLEKLADRFIDTPINPKGTNPVEDVRLMMLYRKIFRRERPDAIFFYTVKPNIYGSLAAGACGIFHIAVTTGLGYAFINESVVSRITRTLYKAAFRKAAQVWFLNGDDRLAFVERHLVDERKTFVLRGEGIDLDRFHVGSLEKPSPATFLLIARMLWDKGVGEFVEAARIVGREYPGTRFQLLGFLGAGNPSSISSRQMDEWQAEGVVEYLGETDDVRPFIGAATCVVLPSYREGIPFSLMEASASGRPIVTTDTAGCREVVEDGVTGFMCEVKDPAGLARCMKKVIELAPTQYKAMALAGRAKIEREFDVNIITGEYLATLSEI